MKNKKQIFLGLSFIIATFIFVSFGINYAKAQTASDPCAGLSEGDSCQAGGVAGTCQGGSCTQTSSGGTYQLPVAGSGGTTGPGATNAGGGGTTGPGATTNTGGGGTTGPGATGTVNCDTGYTNISGVCFPSQTNLPSSDVKTIITNLLYWLLGIFGVVAIIAFAISGFQYLMSAGNENMIETAKRNMLWSIVGVVVALSGLVIVYAIDAALRGNSMF